MDKCISLENVFFTKGIAASDKLENLSSSTSLASTEFFGRRDAEKQWEHAYPQHVGRADVFIGCGV